MVNLDKKLKIAFLDIKKGTSCRSLFSAVNMRNFAILSCELGADFFWATAQIIGKIGYDVIIMGFTSNNSDIQAYRDFFKANPQAEIFMIIGEYEQHCNIACYYEKRKYHILRNFEGKCRVVTSDPQLVIDDTFLNLNAIISRNPNRNINKKYDCIYYGRWREGRKKYFEKYITGIYLSTSDKNKVLFHNANCAPKSYIAPLNWDKGRETLNLFRYSLYIEDEYTHNNYNCLANRYYEAGICNNVLFFDKDCENTIKRSHLGAFWNEVQNYIVSDNDNLQDKIAECNSDFAKHLAIQKEWHKQDIIEREYVLETLKSIIYGKA